MILTRVYFTVGYRLNKFCGEHLIVVNESPEPEPAYPPHQRSVPNAADSSNDIERHAHSDLFKTNSIVRDGPVAEALIQNEQMFHHLKILKPSPSETENERRKSASNGEQLTLEKPNPRKGIYSQVCFRFLFDFHGIFSSNTFLSDLSKSLFKISHFLAFRQTNAQYFLFETIQFNKTNKENSAHSSHISVITSFT